MIQPDDFLSSADACLQASTTPTKEAHLRSSISRAYYAAFHHAKARAQGLHGIMVAPPAEHTKLIKALQNHHHQALRTAGNRLNGLYGKRLKADYYLTDDLSESDAKTALKAARTLIRDFT